MLGSPNGRAAGYLLAQHKAQLGRDKYISKITMFRPDPLGKRANLIFWVDDVPKPTPQIEEPEGWSSRARIKARSLGRCNDSENGVREHVVWG